MFGRVDKDLSQQIFLLFPLYYHHQLQFNHLLFHCLLLNLVLVMAEIMQNCYYFNRFYPHKQNGNS